VIFGSIVIVTIVWIIIAGLSHQQHTVKLWPEDGETENMLSLAFGAPMAYGAVKTVYSYLGYYNVCHLGGEIKRPEVNIPRSIFISIAGIAVLYLLMNVAVMGVVHYQSINVNDKYLVSTFMEKLYGHRAGSAITVLILCIAMSSLFAVVLGYSRVPYAAAVDGNFFKIFGRLHPTKGFPYISLLVLCGLGLIFSLFMKLSEVITAILAMRIVIQFIGQAVGVVLLRAKFGSKHLPFKMWLFPIPVILSISIWLFLLVSTGWFAVWGSVIAVAGAITYAITRNRRR
jgi:amino acid transporter